MDQASRKPRILILDDIATDAELAARELRRSSLSCQIKVVDDRASFERALEEFVPDLVLSDYSMPGFRGPEALAIARAARPDLPVIIMSGTIGEELAIDMMKAGATDYLLKDRMARLGSAVERALKEAEERALRQQAERDLRESEELHRTVFETLSEGILVVDARGLVVSGNASAERITGLGVRELVGRPVFAGPLKLLGEDGAPLAPGTSPLVRTLRDGAPVVQEIVALGLPDGSIKALSLSCQPIFMDDERGKRGPFAGVVSFADVTERRALEAQLRQAQKLESVGQLAGGIAHDFNNLMTAVLGYSEMLLTRLPEGSPLREDVDEIRKAGQRAAALTRQLLAFSRRQLMVPKVVELNDIVAGMEAMLRRVIAENVRISLHLGARPSRVKADPGQLEQVLLNLAINGADAMQAGGQLTIETGNVELDETYARGRIGVAPGPHVMLAVSDTGHGMDTATQARMFEPFFTTKEKGRGTGLGLATVHGIVNQSGGNIWVYSEIGRGTTFKVYLPAVAGEARRMEEARASAPVLRGSETVLVAEDEPQLRPLIRGVLELHGYRVLLAPHGEAALHVCQTHAGSIELIVTDVVMPGMGGEELARRATAMRPGMRVLFLSGYSDHAIEEQGLLPAGHAFLAKPFSNNALATKVREVLDARPSGAAAQGN